MPALDGIRGVAILLVMLHHFTIYGGMEPGFRVDKIFYKVTYAGWSGVDLFFVLSGLLITGILLDAKGGIHYFRNFYIRRFLRIFPLYYGFLAVVFILIPRLVPLSADFQTLLGDQSWYWSYLVNLQMGVQGWHKFYGIGHLWSLAIEEQFYLIWPLVVFVLDRRGLAIACLLLVATGLSFRLALSLVGYPDTGPYLLTPGRVDTLAVGGLLALAVRRPSALSILSRLKWPLALLSGVALSVLFVWKRELEPGDVVVQTIGFTLLACFFGSVLAIVVTAPPTATISKAFSDRRLAFFGRYSYGLYVFHQPVAILLAANVISVQAVPRLVGSQLPGQVLFTLVATAVSLGLALPSWHLYEARFLKLKDRFPRPLPSGRDLDSK